MNLINTINLKADTMKKFLLLIPFLFLKGYAQYVSETADFRPKIFEPSPNVSQMIKYINQPVNYSSGIPQISVPIYQIKLGDINIPISLDYNAGGVKVAQESTNIGLGWNLNAGGAITRTIRGIIDDCYYSIYDGKYGGIIYATQPLSELAMDVQDIIELVENGGYDPNGAPSKLGIIDFGADLFSYNIPEGGKSFLYDSEVHKFYELEQSNNKIEYFTDPNGIKRIYKWIITTPNGIQYIFGEENYNQLTAPDFSEMNSRQVIGAPTLPPQGDGYAEPKGVVTWYLRKVVDKNGNEVNFEYGTNHNVNYANRIPRTSNGTYNGFPSLYTITDVDEKYLKKISFSTGHIDFVYDSNRLDLKNSNKLNSINIFRDASGSDESIKKINLQQSYYTHVVRQGINHPFDSENYERLKLDEVEINGEEADNIMKYKFDYDATPLPQKFSNSQDYWGGYNGRSNISLTPPATFYILDPLTSEESYSDVGFEEIERNVEKDFVTAGTLNKITYPTGGYTKYEYEPNTISDYAYLDGALSVPEELFVKNIKNPYQLNNYNFSFPPEDPESGFLPCYKEVVNELELEFKCYSFTLNHPLQSKLKVSLNSFCPEGSVSTTEDVIPAEGEVVCNFGPAQLKRIDGSNIEHWMFTSLGEYYISVKFQGSIGLFEYSDNNPNNDAYFNVAVEAKEDLTPDIRVVGGLRVKKIENYDKNDNLVSRRKFKYEFNNEQGKLLSSGGGWLPRFGLYENLFVHNVINYDTPLDFMFVLLMTDFNLNSTVTDRVLYNKVEETFENVYNPSVNYTKLYSYPYSPFRINSDPIRGELQIIRQLPYINVFSKAGKLGSEINFNANGNENSKVFHDYNFNDNLSKRIFSGFNLNNLNLNIGGNMTLVNTYVIDYYDYTQPITTLQNISTEILESGEIQNKTFYHYEGENPLLPSSQTTTNSLGEEIRTEYKYPQDLIGVEQSPYMQQLTAANRIAEPVKTETYLNGEKTSERHVKYGKSSATEDLLLPVEEHLKIGSGNININSSSDRKITYTKYDADGHLLEYKLENGTSVRIAWAYSNKTDSEGLIGGPYPVAKIENPPTNDPDFEGFIYNLKNSSLSSIDEHEIENIIRLMRNFYPDSIITGYTYDPLIGVTSIIQPNGQTEYYEYDNAGRLEEVYIMEGGTKKILKTVDYNYQH